jgi:hypothetical protein
MNVREPLLARGSPPQQLNWWQNFHSSVPEFQLNNHQSKQVKADPHFRMQFCCLYHFLRTLFHRNRYIASNWKTVKNAAEKSTHKKLQGTFYKKDKIAWASLWSNKIEKSLYKIGSIWYLEMPKNWIKNHVPSCSFGQTLRSCLGKRTFVQNPLKNLRKMALRNFKPLFVEITPFFKCLFNHILSMFKVFLKHRRILCVWIARWMKFEKLEKL